MTQVNVPQPSELQHSPNLQDEIDYPTTTIEGGVVHFEALEWTGDFPPPEILRAYRDVIPGGGTILLNMARDLQAHRNGCELLELQQQRLAMDHSYKIHARGQWIGGAALLSSIGVAGLLAWLSKSIWPGVFLVSAVASSALPSLIDSFRGLRSQRGSNHQGNKSPREPTT